MSINGEASSAVEPIRFINFLVLGDSGCGKTRIIQSYLKNKDLNGISNLSIFTTYDYNLGDPNANVRVHLVDVLGSCDIARATKSFDSADGAIFFYDISNPQSLDNLRYVWIPTFMTCSNFNVPKILVGNKKDLRAFDSPQPNRVSFFRGMKAKNSCSMDMFLECSAEDDESVERVFEAAYSYFI